MIAETILRAIRKFSVAGTLSLLRQNYIPAFIIAALASTISPTLLGKGVDGNILILPLFLPTLMAFAAIPLTSVNLMRPGVLMTLVLLGAIVTIATHALAYMKLGLIMPQLQKGACVPNPLKNCREPMDFFDAIYFSVVTFTTLGYGDIQPKSQYRIMSALQALYGYVYLGMLVGMMANSVQRGASVRRNDNPNDTNDR